MGTTTNKDSRFEIRLTQEQRNQLNQAAEIKGLSCSQWALTNLLDAAKRDIKEAHIIKLDDTAWEEFTQALDDPMPEATRRLLESEPVWQ